jgi:LacI family transcriptional regulator
LAITIYDIAREAKVGIGTVSRVLNNSTKVTDATREKVILVARKLNYQPHAFAQALARKKSNTLCAIIPFFTNYFFIEVLQGVQDTLASLGYDLIIHGANNQEQLEEYLLRSMKKGRVDGTLLFSLELPERFVEVFSEKKLPLVLVDTFHPMFDSIRVNNTEGTRIAVEHLLDAGHRNIGMINANIKSVPAKERLQAFKNTLRRHGIEARQENMMNSSQTKNDGFSWEAGYESMQQFLHSGTPLPSAFVVSSDIQSIGVLAALRENNLHVPDDVALVSFDDIEVAKYFDLTTMRQPMYKMGELAVKKIIERINNNNIEASSLDFVPELVVRGSSGVNYHTLSRTISG